MKRLAIMMGFLGLAPCAFATPQPVRWTASSGAQTQAPASKKDVLGKLKILQDKQILDSTDLENAIRKQLNDTLTMDVATDDFTVASRRTGLVTKKIDELNKRRSELNARREIVDRVIFQIDSKWDGKSRLQDFLTQTFIEMASTDLADGRDNRLWKEFTYLSMVMREGAEPGEDVISLFEGYLNYASVLEPKTPAEFLASRNYTNGLESETAHASSRDTLGDGVTTPVAPPKISAPLLKTASAHEAPLPTASQISVSATKAPETAAKAQADSGQVPMPPLPAGTADSPEALRASKSTTSAATHSASDLATPPPQPAPAQRINN